MIRRPPRSTRVRSSAASDVYKRQVLPQWTSLVGSPAFVQSSGRGPFHSSTQEASGFRAGFLISLAGSAGKALPGLASADALERSEGAYLHFDPPLPEEIRLLLPDLFQWLNGTIGSCAGKCMQVRGYLAHLA